MLRKQRVNRLLAKAVQQHMACWDSCSACPLHESATQKVHFRGDIPCDVLFVGEAPGPSENAVGLPFVGQVSEYLDRIIDDAFTACNKPLSRLLATADIGSDKVLTFKDVVGMKALMQANYQPKAKFQPLTYAITNSVLCQPPPEGDTSLPRDPTREEQQACSSRLAAFMNLCRPKLVVCVGKVASKAVLHLMMDTGNYIRTLDMWHPGYIARLEDKDFGVAKCSLQLQEAIVNIFGPNYGPSV